MNLATVRPGDLIRADVRGNRFIAEVIDKEPGQLELAPVAGTFLPTYRVKARQVVEHWRKAGRRKASS